MARAAGETAGHVQQERRQGTCSRRDGRARAARETAGNMQRATHKRTDMYMYAHLIYSFNGYIKNAYSASGKFLPKLTPTALFEYITSLT